MKIKRITFIFCSIVLAALSGCIETPDASQFLAPTISASVTTTVGGTATITCQLSKGARSSQITFRLSKSQSMSDAIVKTVIGVPDKSCSASFSGLEKGTQYYFDAEASGGRSSCRSSVGTFKTSEVFEIDKDTKQINYQQQYVEFEVVSSIGLSVQIEDGANWVRESDTKAATKYRKTFLVDYNSSVEERRATIVFKSDAGGESRTVKIIQAGGPIMIPDKNFKTYLVENFDKDGDGEISYEEGRDITYIRVETNNITSLQGIEYFQNLEVLDAYGSWDNDVQKCNGRLTSLDVSHNTALISLHCEYNQLKNLDVSENTALTSLGCGYNHLTSLDVSKNISLTLLDCNNNQLTSLDVSNITALSLLDCYSNQLTSLEVSTLGCLRCWNNKLTSLDVSNAALSILNCGNNQLTSLDVSGNTALTELSCENNQLKNLDLSTNTALVRLYCSNNLLTTLDVSKNTALTSLDCYGNPNLSMVWLASGQNINDLNYDSSVTKLVHKDDKVNIPDANFKRYLVENFDKNGNGEIEYTEAYEISHIGCTRLNIRSLVGVESMVQLVDINCNENNLSEINLSANTKLTHLSCADNDLTSLDLQYNKSLVYLHCFSNQLTKLDVSRNTSLSELKCYANQLAILDVSKNTALTLLYCGGNQLTSLDVSSNVALTNMRCENNQLSILDVSNNVALEELDCNGNPNLSMVWIASGQNINDLNYNSSVTKLVHKDDKVNIPDANFKRYLAQNFDKDGDGEISMVEAESIREIHVCTDDIETLEGIEYFINLGYLDACGTGEDINGKWVSNGKLRSLNVLRNTALYCLYCENNQLTSLDVSKNIDLKQLRCQGNHLNTLDVSRNTILRLLYCRSNQLISLDVSNNTKLTDLLCENNQLANLDVSRNTSLTILSCLNNQLTTLDVSKNSDLTMLDCRNNQLANLDVSKNSALTTLYCYDNQLTTLDVSNNTALRDLRCWNENMTELWLAYGQTINVLEYNRETTTIRYK